MNSMNGFGDITDQLQGKLDTFMDRLNSASSSYSRRANKARGGEKGEIIPSGYRLGKLKNFDKNQMQLYKQMLGYVSPDSYLARLSGGDESLFEEMEAPALRQFNALQGNLASRFSGMGMGARNSSGFQNMSNQYASDFAQDLASRRQDLQRQAILDLQGLSRELLSQRPFEKNLIKKQYPQQQPDQSGDLLGGILSGLAGAAGGFMGGGVPGAIAGGGSGFYSGYRGGY